MRMPKLDQFLRIREAAEHPVVFIGQRGRGKSHFMAVLHHAFANPGPVDTWA